MVSSFTRRATLAWRLTRVDEFLAFVLVTTFFGFNVAGAFQFSIPLVATLLGNLLAVAFAFMINDVEDADDDARDAKKVHRNPISAGHVAPRTAYIACFLVAMGSAAFYAVAGWRPFVLGVLCLLLGLLYSWRAVRLKAIPGVDLASHVLLLAALQFLCAYFTFDVSGWRWLLPCGFVIAVSLYGQLFNQLRDLECDRQAGFVNTVGLAGERFAHILVYGMIVLALALLVACVALGIVPVRVMVVAFVLAPFVLIRQLRQSDSRRFQGDTTGPFQEPALIIGVVTLLAWWFGGMVGAPLM